MRVLITGARGFIGHALTDALLARAPRGATDGVTEIVALDLAPARADTDPRVRPLVGDGGDSALLARVFAQPVDLVFALGATLTHEAEADFARGLEVNVLGMLRLIEACRAQSRVPRLVYTSSIAAFGGPLPETVDDDVPRTPLTSYGTHKAIVELLLNDATRKGFVDARALRLPIVLTRPGPPVPSISDRLAALVREPLRGADAIAPLQPDTRIVVSSVQAVAGALRTLAGLPADALGHFRAFNLPSLSVRVGELVDALAAAPRRRGTDTRVGRVRWQPDATMQAIVDQWPQRFDSSHARALGIAGSSSLEALIDDFIEQDRQTAR
jgi:nucleoside-diphosphate-sugar epimerase